MELGELIVAGEVPGDPVAARRLRAAALEKEPFAALKADPEMLIKLAEAAFAVAAGRQAPMSHVARMRRPDPRSRLRRSRLPALRQRRSDVRLRLLPG